MRRILRFLPEADADTIAAVAWYNAQRKSLGKALRSEIREMVARIRANPLLNGLIGVNLRQAILTRFPYSIIYQVSDEEILIVAVVHSARDDSVWRARINN